MEPMTETPDLRRAVRAVAEQVQAEDAAPLTAVKVWLDPLVAHVEAALPEYAAAAPLKAVLEGWRDDLANPFLARRDIGIKSERESAQRKIDDTLPLFENEFAARRWLEDKATLSPENVGKRQGWNPAAYEHGVRAQANVFIRTPETIRQRHGELGPVITWITERAQSTLTAVASAPPVQLAPPVERPQRAQRTAHTGPRPDAA